MATTTKVCRVCGVEYPYCRTARPDGLYRWDNVACCPEHAAVFFARVAAARSGAPAPAEESVSEETYSEDFYYEEDFDYEDDSDYSTDDDVLIL